MKTGGTAPAPESRPVMDEKPDLPGLRSWTAVYAVALGAFVFWVVLLTWLTRHYS
ncbi:MAG: hypothetical protein ACHQ5A_09545 [Opitutales bacterium]